MVTRQQTTGQLATASPKDECRHSALWHRTCRFEDEKRKSMAKKKNLQDRPGAQGASKKPHSRGKKAGDPAKAASQTRQPYEQDTKRRIGQFSGTGEAPLKK
jgi:hypothetical protein